MIVCFFVFSTGSPWRASSEGLCEELRARAAAARALDGRVREAPEPAGEEVGSEAAAWFLKEREYKKSADILMRFVCEL